MALIITTPNTRVSGLIPGMGFQAVMQFVYDNSYPTGGEVADLSATFPNEVFGGVPIADTLNDGGFISRYVRAANGAPASGIIQVYEKPASGAVGAIGALPEAGNARDLSAINGQLWMFWGR